MQIYNKIYYICMGRYWYQIIVWISSIPSQIYESKKIFQVDKVRCVTSWRMFLSCAQLRTVTQLYVHLSPIVIMVKKFPEFIELIHGRSTSNIVQCESRPVDWEQPCSQYPWLVHQPLSPHHSRQHTPASQPPLSANHRPQHITPANQEPWYKHTTVIMYSSFHRWKNIWYRSIFT